MTGILRAAVTTSTCLPPAGSSKRLLLEHRIKRQHPLCRATSFWKGVKNQLVQATNPWNGLVFSLPSAC